MLNKHSGLSPGLLSFFIFISWSSGNAFALDAYTDRDAFINQASISYDIETEDFDSLPIGNVANQNNFAGELTVTGSSSENLFIGNAFTTISPDHYLALNNTDTAFKANDILTLTFSEPITGLGFFIITEEDLQAGDFELSVASGSVNSSNIASTVLSGANGYYIGFIDDAPNPSITQAQLTASDLDFDFNYTIDDVSIAFLRNTSNTGPPGNTGSTSGGNGSTGLISLLLMIIFLGSKHFRSRGLL